MMNEELEQPTPDTPLKRARQREELRREERRRKLRIIRNILNIIFMLTALAGVAYYVLADKYAGSIIIIVAMSFKMVEASIRMIKL